MNVTHLKLIVHNRGAAGSGSRQERMRGREEGKGTKSISPAAWATFSWAWWHGTVIWHMGNRGKMIRSSRPGQFRLYCEFKGSVGYMRFSVERKGRGGNKSREKQEIKKREKRKLPILNFWNWKDGSAVQSPGYSSGQPGFSTLHLHSSAQSSVISVLGNPVPSSGLPRYQASTWYTDICVDYAHKIIIKM